MNNLSDLNDSISVNLSAVYGSGKNNGTTFTNATFTFILNTAFRTGSGSGIGSGLEDLLHLNTFAFTCTIKNVFRTKYVNDSIFITSGAVRGSGKNSRTTFTIVTFTPTIKKVFRTGSAIVTFTSTI